MNFKQLLTGAELVTTGQAKYHITLEEIQEQIDAAPKRLASPIDLVDLSDIKVVRIGSGEMEIHLIATVYARYGVWPIPVPFPIKVVAVPSFRSDEGATYLQPSVIGIRPSDVVNGLPKELQAALRGAAGLAAKPFTSIASTVPVKYLSGKAAALGGRISNSRVGRLVGKVASKGGSALGTGRGAVETALNTIVVRAVRLYLDRVPIHVLPDDEQGKFAKDVADSIAIGEGYIEVSLSTTRHVGLTNLRKSIAIGLAALVVGGIALLILL